MSLKLLLALLSFSKELFKEKRDDFNFSSSNFSVRKTIRMSIFVLLCVYAGVITEQLFDISKVVIDIEEKNMLLKIDHLKTSIENDQLKEELEKLKHTNEILKSICR